MIHATTTMLSSFLADDPDPLGRQVRAVHAVGRDAVAGDEGVAAEGARHGVLHPQGQVRLHLFGLMAQPPIYI